MKKVLVNFAMLFGLIGFVGFLFLIIAGYFGCCAEITTVIYHRIVTVFLSLAFVIFAICMINNCIKGKSGDQ